MEGRDDRLVPRQKPLQDRAVVPGGRSGPRDDPEQAVLVLDVDEIEQFRPGDDLIPEPPNVAGQIRRPFVHRKRVDITLNANLRQRLHETPAVVGNPTGHTPGGEVEHPETSRVVAHFVAPPDHQRGPRCPR